MWGSQARSLPALCQAGGTSLPVQTQVQSARCRQWASGVRTTPGSASPGLVRVDPQPTSSAPPSLSPSPARGRQRAGHSRDSTERPGHPGRRVRNASGVRLHGGP